MEPLPAGRKLASLARRVLEPDAHRPLPTARPAVLAAAGEKARLPGGPYGQRERVVRNRGFTLIELMVTVAVLAILLTIALPSFRGVMQSNRVATSTNELIAVLSLARSEAIRNSRGSGACASAAGTGCDGTWEQGLMVWADTNGNGEFDAAEAVLRFVAAKPQMKLGAEADRVTFDGRGRRRGSGDFAIQLEPADCGAQPYQRTISVSRTGQISTAKGACE